MPSLEPQSVYTWVCYSLVTTYLYSISQGIAGISFAHVYVCVPSTPSPTKFCFGNKVPAVLGLTYVAEVDRELPGIPFSFPPECWK